ncbi:bile acid:sodium symporter family protein [Marinoscillum sp. MHG1-6]|uniref:bile acid:sodium symporter family protein n=1 Tax=Marinoscillum sp. MHG1-6 TaxID=2959627 RepID=UPI002157D30C|nr:bile acid:sodium symporter family protein [Marinoscillum sp. MHG1-6]
MFEVLSQIDNVKLNFGTEGKVILQMTIAFIMFGVALELKIEDFKRLFYTPKPVFIGIISQFILMPLITFLIVIIIGAHIPVTIGLGMILVASCPGGNISNFMSTLARGNIALSVSLTAFSSIGGLLLTPFNFTFWGGLYMHFYENPGADGLVRNLQIDTWMVLQTLIILLGIPIILGLLFQHRFPDITLKIVKYIKAFSILAFFSIVIILFIKNYDLFLGYIRYIFFIVLFHNAAALSGGYTLGSIASLSKKDCKTISIETGIQNSALALALLFDPAIFPENIPVGGMAYIAGWWGLWHIVSGLTIASIWSGFSLRNISNEE